MEIKKSTRQNKKYMVKVNDENKSQWIHFGDVRYSHYKDSTPLKLYSHLNHNDDYRRYRYLARAKGIRDKNGWLTYHNKFSPNYWSINYLW